METMPWALLLSVTGAVAALLGLAFWRRSLALLATRQELSAASARLREHAEGQRKAEQEARQARAETRELRDKLASTKKRAFNAKDELAELHAQLQRAEERLASQEQASAQLLRELEHARAQQTERSARPGQTAKLAKDARAAQDVVPAPAPAQPASPELEQRLKLQAADLERLQQELAQQRQATAAAEGELAAQREELRMLARRVEDYRRVDLIGKRQQELLADKLAHFQRRHYEAVSELAALKGRPAPARPPDLPADTATEDPARDEHEAGPEVGPPALTGETPASQHQG